MKYVRINSEDGASEPMSLPKWHREWSGHYTNHGDRFGYIADFRKSGEWLLTVREYVLINGERFVIGDIAYQVTVETLALARDISARIDAGTDFHKAVGAAYEADY